SIIIPAYNEEESIVSVIDEIRNHLKQAELDFPIIVVDDGSTDQTSQKAESRGVTVLRHDENIGYGASLKTGIRYAETEWVIIIDADGTYPASAIPEMIKYAKTQD